MQVGVRAHGGAGWDVGPWGVGRDPRGAVSVHHRDFALLYVWVLVPRLRGLLCALVPTIFVINPYRSDSYNDNFSTYSSRRSAGTESL